MQLAAHFVAPNGVDSGAGGPAAGASVPRTPHRLRDGHSLSKIIDDLERRWLLGLKVYDKTPGSPSPSPSKTGSPSSNHLKPKKTYERIRYLHFHARLDDALANFEKVAPKLAHEDRLDRLYELLHDGTPSSITRPSENKFSLQPTRSVSQTARFQSLSQDEPDSSQYTTAPDPGSPTDDENDYATSLSPTVSAQRRAQASLHHFLPPIFRKRHLESTSETEKSTKLTKLTETLKRKQTLVNPSALQHPEDLPPFKRPALDMARSFNYAGPTRAPSANTSFNSMWSSQQTQADTANTSFASEADLQKQQYSQETKSKIVSVYGVALDEQGLSTRLEKQASGSQQHPDLKMRVSQDLISECSSTFGSIDEDDLVNMSFEVEAPEHSMPPMPLNPLSQNQSAHQPARLPMYSERGISSMKPKSTSNPSIAKPAITESISPPKGRIPKLSPTKQSPVTQSPSLQKSPDRATPKESPTKITHHIRNITTQNLFVDDIPDELKDVPYHVIFVCQRVAIDNSLTVQEVMQGMDVSTVSKDFGIFWNALQSHPNIGNMKAKESNRLWPASKRRFDGFTFKGKIDLGKKQTDSVFCLRLMPVHADKSCRFQRHFGSDRFLYLDAPDLNSSESQRFNSRDRQQIREQWIKWLRTEHAFLGRKWRVFHLEPLKRKNTTTTRKAHDKRIVLFATEGWGIDRPCSIGEMLNWFFPFVRNAEQSYCKVYARFDLGLSRTFPTIVFKPSQVRRVPDCLANGTPEATKFNDTKLLWPKVPRGKVMNDGCSVMSVGAAREIWKQYKKATGVNGPLPSAFQGRIAGAKGLWMISAESYTKDPNDLEIWIEISDSQLKFKPHIEDLDDTKYDPHRLTFEVSNYSSAPTPSELHISFIPILVDRGVSKGTIADFMKDQLEYEREQLLGKVIDPVKVYDYVHKNGSKSRDVADAEGPVTLPDSVEEKIKMLLESGFVPTQFHFLARNIELFIKLQQSRQEAKLRTPLGKSTFLYGVADPMGVLKPGEIQVQFSTSFTDEMTDETYHCLRDTDVLVARHPACRRSDMQKVHAVVHPDLSHLMDIVVFPSVGQYPLAGKLQGGDYDGDLFWLCWESKLVSPFKNAPAPVVDPDPAQYGIKVDKRKLSEVMTTNNLADVDSLLKKAFAFREKSSILGMVTDYLEEQVYEQNQVHSVSLDQLCDIHDLLVDAPKQGYTFSREDFERYKHSPESRLERAKPRRPTYKAAMRECLEKKTEADKAKARPRRYNPNPSNVLDFLYFEVVCAENQRTMERVKAAIPSDQETEPDAALLYPYRYLKEQRSAVIDEELRSISEKANEIRVIWNRASHPPDHAAADWPKTVSECYDKFRSIAPVAPTHADVAPWLAPCTGAGVRAWDVIRASTLYATAASQVKKSAFVWNMAGGELARLKADSVPGTRAMVGVIRGNLRPKPVKTVVLWDDEESEASGESGDDEVGVVVG